MMSLEVAFERASYLSSRGKVVRRSLAVRSFAAELELCAQRRSGVRS
jgi:hypothetical protein